MATTMTHVAKSFGLHIEMSFGCNEILNRSVSPGSTGGLGYSVQVRTAQFSNTIDKCDLSIAMR